eukprot:3816029-Prymnesium_polylepis.1
MNECDHPGLIPERQHLGNVVEKQDVRALQDGPNQCDAKRLVNFIQHERNNGHVDIRPFWVLGCRRSDECGGHADHVAQLPQIRIRIMGGRGAVRQIFTQRTPDEQ